ncbi:beta-N-acetylhexosaminidase [Deinococcus sp.]|uniref:beta-N-acetylhexosaminidase n=1 Tax=Deinococcus sp. TaxID=47478 RepID=UPI002869EA97|nr:beta-N-acetylhexosaminidase [Deinococcus sp.]
MTDVNPERTLVIDLAGPELGRAEGRWLRNHPVGGVCLFARNITTPGRTARLVADIRDALGRDVLIATDQEGGAVLRRLDVPQAPTPQGLGVLDDAEAAYQAGQIAARGLLELGINWNYAPSVDVNVDPLNPVIGERSFGADPARVAALGVAWARGSEDAGVLSAVKHFPGHGDTRVDSHLALPVVDKSRAALEAAEWVPFRDAVRAGVGSIMTAHILYPALDAVHPATLSPAILTGLLRQEWGYDGVIVTDAMDMRAVADRYPDGLGAGLALSAGADAVLVCGHGDASLHDVHARALQGALRSSALTEARVAEAAGRLGRALARFPGTPRPYTAGQRSVDERVTDDWATRMLTWHGERIHLDPTRPVLLLAPTQPDVGGPYGDSLSGETLANALREAFPRAIFVASDDLGAAQNALSAHPDVLVLLATTGRWGIPASTLALAEALALNTRPALHLALWSPDAVDALRLPAVVTHGFRAANLRALGAELLG